MAKIEPILMKKEEPKRRTKKEDSISGMKVAIAMLERRLKSFQREKEGPGTENMIRQYESRIKKLKYDLAELEGS